MAHLRIERSADPSARGDRIALSEGVSTIGREQGNSVVVADETVSRRHARLVVAGNTCMIRDLGSANGTLVNGKRVSEAQLWDGDRVQLGSAVLIFEDPAGTVLLELPPLGEAEDGLASPPQSTTAPPTPPQPARTPPTPPVQPPLSPPPPMLPKPAPAPPPLIPVARPPHHPPQMPAVRTPRPRSSARWLAIGLALSIPLLVAAGWALLRASGPGSAAAGDAGDLSTRPLLSAAAEVQELPSIPIRRGAKLASGRIADAAGGRLTTDDGLTITVPARALGGDRKIAIYEAEVPPPAFAAGSVGGGAAAPAEVLRAWDIDVGREDGLFPAAVEVSVELGAAGAGSGAIIVPAISIDGKRWEILRSRREGDTLVFETRHFSGTGLFALEVGLSGLIKAIPPALAIVAVAYVVIERVKELPEWCHPYAPWVSLDTNPDGFAIYWSKKLPGVDPKTGFRDEAGYLAELQKVNDEYAQLGGGGPSGAATRTSEILELKERYLMPEQVRRVREALVFAQQYLKSRDIDRPVLTLPVYVVPNIPKKSGNLSAYVFNPWSGRRYMIVATDTPTSALWTTALHELLHHYQTGYVWIDRSGHLPLMEASALLMEREAAAYYETHGKPHNESEGKALAQLLVLRHGLNGPDTWDEEFVQRFGYGLTWFVEYLRDEEYVGVLKTKNAATFHSELLTHWGGRWTGALHKGLRWAAGGSDADLAAAFLDFAQNFALKGPEDDGGERSPYGTKYGCCPLSESPYSDHSVEYGLSSSVFDFTKASSFKLGDDVIKPWSIQFFELRPPGRANASVVVRVPREWFPEGRQKRGVFLRTAPGEAEVVPLAEVDKAPEECADSFARMDAVDRTYLYVADTGQTGSGYVYDFKPASLSLLEPPTELKVSTSGQKMTLTWKAPPSPVERYLVYTGGSRTPATTVEGKTTTAEITVTGEVPAVHVTSAVVMCTGADGDPVYLESAESETVGGVDAGTWLITFDIDPRFPEDTSGANAFHNWSRLGFLVTHSVEVRPDGTFHLEHSWTDPKGTKNSIKGDGTFRDSRLHMEGTFSSSRDWTEGGPPHPNKYSQSMQGKFTANGRFIRDEWFGTDVRGTYEVSISEHYCAQGYNDECLKWVDRSGTFPGLVTPLRSSIEAFVRKPATP